MKKWMLIISGITLLAAILSYGYLPDKIPIHWGLSEADSFAEKPFIFVMAFLSFIFTIGHLVIRHRIPNNVAVSRAENTYFLFFNIMILIISLFTIWQSLDPNSKDIKVVVLPFICILFMSAGNMMPKLKTNHFIGIRTPWTLGNPHVWYKTHRFSGKLWFFGGLLSLIGYVMPNGLFEIYIAMLVGAMIVCPILYSLICSLKQYH